MCSTRHIIYDFSVFGMKHRIPGYIVYSIAAIVCFSILFSTLYLFRQKKETDSVKNIMTTTAEKMLFEAKKSMENRESFGRKTEFVETSSSVYSHGAIRIVKNSKFENVDEPSQSMMQQLNSLAGYGKRKIEPIELSQEDLNKKIIIKANAAKASVKTLGVPVLGLPDSHSASRITMINAPVDYKLFRDIKTWKAFESTHKGDFPDIDFAEKNIIILVSLSNFPPGIFKILDIVENAKEIIVKYRVDPFAMAARNVPDKHNYYAAAAIPKSDLPIKLVQTR